MPGNLAAGGVGWEGEGECGALVSPTNPTAADVFACCFFIHILYQRTLLTHKREP